MVRTWVYNVRGLERSALDALHRSAQIGGVAPRTSTVTRTLTAAAFFKQAETSHETRVLLGRALGRSSLRNNVAVVRAIPWPATRPGGCLMRPRISFQDVRLQNAPPPILLFWNVAGYRSLMDPPRLCAWATAL